MSLLVGVCLVMCIVSVAAMVLGCVLGRSQERRLLLAELKTGEVEMDGYWFRVQAVSFPPRALAGRADEKWLMTRQDHGSDTTHQTLG